MQSNLKMRCNDKTDAIISPGGRSLQQASLLNRAEAILGSAVSDVRSNLLHLVDGLLGEGNKFATNLPTNIDSLCKA